MAYLALYRKYRPSSFDKLIGQDHIVKILKNQIISDKVGHAYLFCGTRGTGKTSAAKIFAKAINCLQPKNGSPCGKCDSCKILQESSSMDILEIDAASNNRVDEIREIRENVQYPPVNCKYKVYIIDEVHMLSDSAFNALLKTLEEPPSHAVFILATTEPQKLPPTILSRCMRFDFRLVSEKLLKKLICDIFDELDIKYEDEAAIMIAKSGEGSVRDSLSIADKCVSFCEGGILRYTDVLEVLGGADKSKIMNVSSAILRGDVGSVLRSINELVSLGKSISVLCKDINGMMRDLCIIKTCDDANSILIYPKERYSEMCQIVENIDVNLLLKCLELFSKLDQDLKHALNPRVMLEATSLKCAKASNDISYDGLIRRVTLLEGQIKHLQSNAVTNHVSEIKKDTDKTDENNKDKKEVDGQADNADSVIKKKS